MINKKWFTLLMTLTLPLIMAACTALNDDRDLLQDKASMGNPSPREEAFSPGISMGELAPDPALVQGQLENGLRYVLLPNPTPKNRISMHLDVQVGSMNEADGQQGSAHYLEHMLFNGLTHYKPGELVEYFQSIGMMFGPDANAHTGFYETVYDIFLPANDSDSMDTALGVLNDYAQGALLLPSEVERERGVILAEKRERDSVSYRTFKASMAFEMPGSMLSRRLPIGTNQVLEKMDQALLKSFYDTWYRPENMVVVMVGDFDLDLAKQQIVKNFQDMVPRAPARLLPLDEWVPHSGIKAFYHHEPEAGNTEVSIQTVKKVGFNADTIQAYQQRTAEELGNMMLQNRLSRAVSQKKAPFSDAGAYSGTYFRNAHFTVVASESDPEQWQESLTFLEQSLRQALVFGFTQEELHRVKAEFIQSLESAANRSESRESPWISRKIVRQINRKRVFQSPDNELDILKPFIESLSPGDVNEVFQSLWDEDHLLIKVTGNVQISGETLSPEAMIAAHYKKCAALQVMPWVNERILDFPYLPRPVSPGKIKAKTVVEESGIVQVDFENKVRLNLRKSDYKKGEFSFKVDFGSGKQSQPPHLPGLAMIAENVVNESGLGTLDQDALEAALAGRDVSLEFGMDQSSFFFSGKADAKEVELVFQLLQASFVDPGFRETSFDLARERYRQMHKELTVSPQGMMALEGDAFLAGGDNRFGMPALRAVNAITLEEIQTWLMPSFARAPLEVSIVGDILPEQIQTLAATYLGSLPMRDLPPYDTAHRQPLFPTGQTRVIDVASRINKGLVHLAFKTDDFWDIHQTRRLNVLSQIFSERLRKHIRESLGVTYSPHAMNEPSQTYEGYGVLHATVATAPEMADQVMLEMEKIADALAREGVNSKELSLVLPPVLTHIRDMHKKNRYWLKSVMSGSWDHPEQLQWPREIYSDYSAITPEELSALASRFLGRENRARLVILAQ
jgi:zinc protease